MKKISKLIFCLIIVNTLSYLIFSDSSAEKIVGQEYIKFTKKRLQNKFTKDTTETIILASCGDEFFRNKGDFRKIIEKSNKRNKVDNSDYFNIKNSYSFWKSDYSIEPMIVIDNHTDTIKSNCCIVFKLCSERTNVITKRIKYEYFYSDLSDTDYDIMRHNSQMELKTITYFWFFGFWIQIKEEKKAPVSYGLD